MQRPIEKPVGARMEELDTPALLVDLPRLQANVAAIGASAGGGPIRTAAWIHKTPAIARIELASENVVGIAVRGVAEAEVFAAAGCDDIRILRPLVTASAKRRAAKLAESIRIVTEDDGIAVGDERMLADCIAVSARVTSVPEPGRAIHDCGQKAIGRDFGDPQIVGNEQLQARASSAEHGVITYPADEHPFAIGDWLRLRPADIATVFALHDFAFAIDDGRLAATWPISARGAFQ